MTHERVNRRLVGRAVALGLVLSCTSAGAAACMSRPVTHTVTIDSTMFQPADLTVNAGDTIVWINKDFFPHTATSQGRFDSASIAPGRSWQYRPADPGEIDYVCTLHPAMTGKLRVK
jgi:plastocyanin